MPCKSLYTTYHSKMWEQFIHITVSPLRIQSAKPKTHTHKIWCSKSDASSPAADSLYQLHRQFRTTSPSDTKERSGGTQSQQPTSTAILVQLDGCSFSPKIDSTYFCKLPKDCINCIPNRCLRFLIKLYPVFECIWHYLPHMFGVCY